MDVALTVSRLDLYSMFILGLLGTGHCVGMCGPLVLAFPARTGRFSSHLLYHLGRLCTYGAVGVAMGAVGFGISQMSSAAGAEPLAWAARIQVGFSLVAGLFLLVMGLWRLEIVEEPVWLSAASAERLPGYYGVLRRAVAGGGEQGMFLLGLLMGLLPCGLSYAAFARALPSGGPIEGAAMMAAFGAGTVPGLLLIGTGASRLAHRFRKQSDILSGLLMVGMSVSLMADAVQAIAG